MSCRTVRLRPQLNLRGLQSDLLHRHCPHKPLPTALPLQQLRQHLLLLLHLRKQQSSSWVTGRGLAVFVSLRLPVCRCACLPVYLFVWLLLLLLLLRFPQISVCIVSKEATDRRHGPSGLNSTSPDPLQWVMPAGLCYTVFYQQRLIYPFSNTCLVSISVQGHIPTVEHIVVLSM